MEITPVDVDSDLALRASYDLERSAMRVGREDMPHWSWQEMSAAWRNPDSGEKALLLAGYEDGRMVTGAVLFLPLLDNTDKCWLGVCVDPAEQHRGLGRQMLDHVVGLAEAEGRTELLAEIKLPFDELSSHRSRRFAEAADFTLSNVEIVRHLQLPVPEGDLDAWAADAARKHGDQYRIETFRDEMPAELVPSLCVLLGQLAVDAPTGEAEWEEEVMTPERFEEGRASLLKAGRRMYETVAIAPDGTVAAQSTLSVPPEGRTDVSQWGTFVHREHRGKRLGLATKAANLRAVQAAHPEMRRVVTQNAETNDQMVAINVLMGFEPVEASVDFIRRVGS